MTHKFLLVGLGLLIFSLFSCKSEGVWIEFEDPIFITYLHDYCDIPITEKGRIDMEDEATCIALGKITDLNLDDIKCSNLVGIKHLVSLVNLSCNNNRLTALDVSGMNRLRTLSCRKNQIKTTNIKECVSLQSFDCSDNQIETLELKGQIALGFLFCKRNRLSQLDVCECKSLQYLSCENQTDDKNNSRQMTLIMPADMQKIWEDIWEKNNPNVMAVFI
ncbi:leucine-rich repeat domain-containing protein [Bacteroides faecis]|uniref:leucine-rich repeat domain-containing protein n=1 Tax=Bacteroides faecis TaxID=674529 RepID=UPI0018A944D2|nr:hypothetical protein [Bacteroides faecis]